MAYGYESTAVDPVFDARQNIIEACKHIAQAENHLFKPDKRCADCVDKHLRMAQSFIDELGSLDRQNMWTNHGRMIQQATARADQMLTMGADPRDVAQVLRGTRKSCLAATRSYELERSSHVREGLKRVYTKKNLAIAAGVIGAIWALRR